jgi:hypothetical protein
MSYLRYLCLFQHSGVQHYMSNMAGVSLVTGTVCPSWTLGFCPCFGGVLIAHLFSFLCCVFSSSSSRVLCIHCIVESFSGLFILDFPFGFR